MRGGLRDVSPPELRDKAILLVITYADPHRHAWVEASLVEIDPLPLIPRRPSYSTTLDWDMYPWTRRVTN